MTHQDIEEIKELLAERKNVVIVTHKNPDGDAMGSSLGLYNYLLRKNHSVKVITPNGYPTFLQWLPGDDKVIEHSENPERAEALIKKADVIFCLDFNALRRIMTDTLNFKIATTTAHTHSVVSELISAGAQNTWAYSNVFDTYSEDRLRLLGHCLGKEMKVLNEYNASFIALSQSDIKKFNFRKGDAEGFVNYPLSIDGIKFSAFFMEMDNEIKISFRSKGNFDVNKFARKHFSGGGHANAAGGEAHGSLDDAVLKFVSVLPEYKEELLK